MEASAVSVLKEKQIINLFLACGVYEHIAKDVPILLTSLTEKDVEDFKSVLRDALNVLEKEGVPTFEIASVDDASVTARSNRLRVALCKICSDTAAIHCNYVDRMKRYFKQTRAYGGDLSKDDWLCKSCYGDFYRDNLAWIQQTNNQSETSNTAPEEEEHSEEAVSIQQSTAKDFYFKSIVYPLFLLVKNLSKEAKHHRKMLVRYIALNKIHICQLPTALYYLRKIKDKPIDVHDFEKECGIGEYECLFGFSSWDEEYTHKELLHKREAERMVKKQIKRDLLEKMVKDKKEKEEEEKRERQRQQSLQQTLQRAEEEALLKTRDEKWKKMKDARAEEDESIAAERKKDDAMKQKRLEKLQEQRKKKKQERTQELKEAEEHIKRQEEELKRKREERYRIQMSEAAQRRAERKADIEAMRLQLH